MRQTPQAVTSTTTSPGPASGSGRETDVSGPPAIGPGERTAHARTGQLAVAGTGPASMADLGARRTMVRSPSVARMILLGSVL
ncbi:hypothetical protein NHL50_11190 [Acidimicrobiia bacterium EGI L10123]|uniref:hypothetical protein n=1 Tax=Salinilacustrithrix flava TaxID=2957203 RepID=UPI003D7C2169|nr:hypothetical protein [Acidimicrobiia bacterium EGI L10123]